MIIGWLELFDENNNKKENKRKRTSVMPHTRANSKHTIKDGNTTKTTNLKNNKRAPKANNNTRNP